MPVTVRVRSPAAGNGRFGVGSGYCRSSLWRNHWEGDRSLKASGGGAATSRHGPSVSPTGCHLPMASPQGGSTAGFARMRTRSEEHTSELQSLMRISYAVFCLKKKKTQKIN